MISIYNGNASMQATAEEVNLQEENVHSAFKKQVDVIMKGYQQRIASIKW